MSTQEHTEPNPTLDPTSSFKVWTSAKGDVQIEAKVRAVSNDPADVRAAYELEMELADKMIEKYVRKAAA